MTPPKKWLMTVPMTQTEFDKMNASMVGGGPWSLSRTDTDGMKRDIATRKNRMRIKDSLNLAFDAVGIERSGSDRYISLMKGDKTIFVFCAEVAA